jgi:hypothetical protein
VWWAEKLGGWEIKLWTWVVGMQHRKKRVRIMEEKPREERKVQG